MKMCLQLSSLYNKVVILRHLRWLTEMLATRNTCSQKGLCLVLAAMVGNHRMCKSVDPMTTFL